MKSKKMKLGLLAGITLFTSACSLPGLGSAEAVEGGVTIVGLGSTESKIITHVIEGMIEHYTDIDAQVLVNMGSSTMANQAMIQGDAQINATKYTGTSVTGELGLEAITDPEEALRVAVEGFDEVFNQKWYPTYGFANTYAFMVTEETASELGLENVSDLEEHAADLSAGVDSSWLSREGDGYQAFTEEYGFDFGDTYPMNLGLAYDAVASDQVDVILGYSTDGRIASYDLVVLEDDRQFFPPYDASPSANFELLESNPVVDDVLLKLEGTISDEQMQQLNFVSDDYLLEPATVAEVFLEENNYFEDKEPYIEPFERGELND